MGRADTHRVAVLCVQLLPQQRLELHPMHRLRWAGVSGMLLIFAGVGAYRQRRRGHAMRHPPRKDAGRGWEVRDVHSRTLPKVHDRKVSRPPQPPTSRPVCVCVCVCVCVVVARTKEWRGVAMGRAEV